MTWYGYICGVRPLNLMHFIMLIISGSDQEKFKILKFAACKTVGAMRIVAKFRAERWYREVEGSFL